MGVEPVEPLLENLPPKIARLSIAVAAYKQAIAIKPDHADAHNNMGIAYGEMGRHEELLR